ncbi:cytochrome c biogenesis protein CcdA [Candidatus Amesbacteria bacterium]|nr:cytochrome c biogenesis protein CcdA [Candidatus Amesbacteria bacterium]
MIFGVSLVASFLAGSLALFAPCCITFLFPSYLGTIFRDRVKVIYYTLVFAAGLAIVLVPVALGFRFAISFLDTYHKGIYYIGALVMIIMGIMTVKPLFKMPKFFDMPKFNPEINTGSVFGLGVMSGLTSSCCAPVLLAAVTLISLSPSTLQALVVALAYVAGIVAPLFIMSVLYQKLTNKIEGPNQRKISNILKHVGAGIFITTGILMAIFNYFDQIQMNQMEPLTRPLRLWVFNISKLFQNFWLDLGVFVLIIILIIIIIMKGSEK